MRIEPSGDQSMDRKCDSSPRETLCCDQSCFWVCWYETFPPACISVLEKPRLTSVSEPAEFTSQRKQKDAERSSVNIEVQVFSTVSVFWRIVCFVVGRLSEGCRVLRVQTLLKRLSPARRSRWNSVHSGWPESTWAPGERRGPDTPDWISWTECDQGLLPAV